MFTTKYMKNQPKPAKRRIKKYEDGGAVEGDSEADERYIEKSRQDQERDNLRYEAQELRTSVPVIVRTNGKVDPVATGRLVANNFTDALGEKYNQPHAARNRAKKKDD